MLLNISSRRAMCLYAFSLEYKNFGDENSSNRFTNFTDARRLIDLQYGLKLLMIVRKHE
jgi:hypothetical protein